MQTYISILRGINVSGQKIIRMTDLKALYEGLKFGDVVTYIQSGNVVFKTAAKENALTLSGKIEKAILKKYAFHVPVIIRTVKEMKGAVLANPFIKQKGIDMERLYVTFLEEKPAPANAESIKAVDYSPDKFIVVDKEVYLYCPVGYGNTKLSNNFFENKLKVKATTRNWKTVNTLIALAGEK